MPIDSTTPPPTKVLLGCSKCGATLPDDAEFCLKCGKSVSSPPKNAVVVEVLAPAKIPRPRRSRRMFLWIPVVILVGVILWALATDTPFSQQLHKFVGFKHDRIILDSS